MNNIDLDKKWADSKNKLYQKARVKKHEFSYPLYNAWWIDIKGMACQKNVFT